MFILTTTMCDGTCGATVHCLCGWFSLLQQVQQDRVTINLYYDWEFFILCVRLYNSLI